MKEITQLTDLLFKEIDNISYVTTDMVDLKIMILGLILVIF